MYLLFVASVAEFSNCEICCLFFNLHCELLICAHLQGKAVGAVEGLQQIGIIIGADRVLALAETVSSGFEILCR